MRATGGFRTAFELLIANELLNDGENPAKKISADKKGAGPHLFHPDNRGDPQLAGANNGYTDKAGLKRSCFFLTEKDR